VELKIINNPQRSRFETLVEGDYAYLDYVFYKGALALVHTYVPPKNRRKGIAFAIIKFALEYAKREHLKIIPGCSSVALYIELHPEYETLVAMQYLS